MKAFLLVFLGGGLGSVLRYSIHRALFSFASAFPWATFAANALSCILLGFLVEWSAKGLLSDSQRLLLMTGLCGGFSTFSTFTGETLHLYQRGLPIAAIANVLANLVVCMICLILGMKLAARVG